MFRKGETDYWLCGSCTFRFSTSPSNPNLANELSNYEESYLQYLRPDRTDTSNFEALRLWLSRFAALDGARLLDVGAGSGKLVRFLRGRGVDAQGLEPSRALFDHFLKDDQAFTSGMLDRFRSSVRTPFDIITAFDVIEHVPDPVAFLADVTALLKPGGFFFVSTPDVGSLTARLFGRRWHFYYPYHLSYFSRATLTRAAAVHGLVVVDDRHRGRLRSIGYMVRYVAEFIGNSDPPRWAERFDDWCVPVNLFDTMYLCLRRTA